MSSAVVSYIFSESEKESLLKRIFSRSRKYPSNLPPHDEQQTQEKNEGT